MKPIIVIAPNTMSDANVKALRDNGICVVVSKNPAELKFMDPLPSAVGRSAVEEAAIQLSRKVMAQGTWSGSETRKTIAEMYVDILIKGTPLDPKPSQKETEAQVYSYERLEEIKRLARIDAKNERDSKKKSSEPDTTP